MWPQTSGTIGHDKRLERVVAVANEQNLGHVVAEVLRGAGTVSP
jgi:hypothetical protein